MNIITSKDFAKRIGVDYRTVLRWDKTGVFPAKRTATSKAYYTQEDVENYFRAKQTSHDGRWICIDGGKCKCSICGAVYDYDDNYCGSCGARMVWDKSEQELLDCRKKAIEGVCCDGRAL